MPITRQTVAKIFGGAGGVGSLAAAALHQGFGAPEMAQTLSAAQGNVPALYLVQIEATWIAATVAFVLIGVGLLMAAFSRPGWLHSLGRAATLWFVAVAGAFAWIGPRWGLDGIAPQVGLLAVLGAATAVAAWLAAPKRA